MLTLVLDRCVRGFSTQSNVLLLSYEDLVLHSIAPGTFCVCECEGKGDVRSQVMMQVWPLKSLVSKKCRVELLQGFFQFPSSSSSFLAVNELSPGSQVCVVNVFAGGPLSASRVQVQVRADVSVDRQLRAAGFADLIRDAVHRQIVLPGMVLSIPFVSHGEKISLRLGVGKCEPMNDSKSSSSSLATSRVCYRIGPNTDLSLVSSHVKEKEEGEQKHSSSSSSSSSFSSSLSVATHAFQDVGGLDSQIEEVCELLDMALHNGHVFSDFGIPAPSGVLLVGPPGTGKSSFARCIEAYCGSDVAFYAVSGPEIVSRYSGDSERKLKELWRDARAHAPAVIFIDEIDAVCVSRDASTSELQQRITATVMTLMDGLSSSSSSSSSSSPSLFVIGATNAPGALDSALRRPGRFDREVELGIPTKTARKAILECQLRHVAHNLTDTDVTEIARQTHGFVGADLSSLLAEAGIVCLRRIHSSTTHSSPAHQEEKLTIVDVREALKHVKPSSLREFLVDVPNVRWTDIGGMESVKRKLQESVEWPLNHPEVFLRLGIAPPQGILLYGPPGCSKTLMARALATESSRNFISIKGPELLSKWVGESEKAIAKVFQRARQASPSIVFFDEIDSVALKRASSGDSTSVTDRVLTQLLVELDGVKQLNDVVFVAATNRPDMIDPALLRPGRIDRILYVGLPDALTRRAIVELELRKLKCDASVNEKCIAYLVEHSDGFSGAEMAMICREAVMVAVEENKDVAALSSKHLIRACNAAAPRTTLEMIDYYDQYRNQHSNLAC